MKCEEKKIFNTRNMAWIVAIKRRKMSGTILTPYKCQYCGKFHLTSRNNGIPPKKFNY